MADDRNRKPSHPDKIDESQQGTTKPDQGGEAELTEKEEQKRGGKNKTTPGPIYDV